MAGCIYATRSLSELKTGSQEDGDTGYETQNPPEWYYEEKFRRGQAFFSRHVSAIVLSMHCSLVSGFSIINLLEPLVFTNKSDTGAKSFKRYFMTFYYIYQWMTTDIWDKTSKGYQSISIVRSMHRNVAKKMKAQFSDKVYVSQYDMGLVQSGFFGAALMYPKEFGINCSQSELDDYVYTWRVIGFRLGIKDEYNICTGTLVHIKTLVKEIEERCLIPALLDPPKDFDKMADAYIDGVNEPIPFRLHSKKSILTLIWDGFGKASPYHLDFTDTLRYWWLKFLTFAMFYIPGVERMLNHHFHSSFQHNMNKHFKQHFKSDMSAYVTKS